MYKNGTKIPKREKKTSKAQPCICNNHVDFEHSVSTPRTSTRNTKSAHTGNASVSRASSTRSLPSVPSDDIFADINNVSAFVYGPGGSDGTDMSQFNPKTKVNDNDKDKQLTDWNGVMQDLFYNLDNVDLGR